MRTVWSGDITIDYANPIQGITLSTSVEDGATIDLDCASLRLLSTVEISCIPLHIIVGAAYNVFTINAQTQSYLSSILLSQYEGGASPWWRQSGRDSPLGILVAVDAPPKTACGLPTATELLFYASSAPLAVPVGRPQTPPDSSPFSGVAGAGLDIRVFAIPLSSDLLYKGATPTPPPSPSSNHSSLEAAFLPRNLLVPVGIDQAVNELQPHKRRTAKDAFDEATERKRKARRKGGEGIAAAAACQVRAETALPSLKHRRSVSNVQLNPQIRPLSRASSVSSVKPSAAHETAPPPLSRPASFSISKSGLASGELSETPSLEQKNKEHISKVVMSGMRLRGLAQSRNRKSRANSSAASPVVRAISDVGDDRKNDEEYKLVYHQVYKGTCFALRRHISTIGLQLHPIALQDIVERLLNIFLSDPFIASSNQDGEEFTASGRKAFGSSTKPLAESPSFFQSAFAIGRDHGSHTPCMTKSKDRATGLT